jgi:hypothetical protein
MFIKHEQEIRELAKFKRSVRLLTSFSVDSIADYFGLSKASNSHILMAEFPLLTCFPNHITWHKHLQSSESFKVFRVSRQDSVTNSTKLLLEPVDGKEVCVPERGQFVCMRIDVNGLQSHSMLKVTSPINHVNQQMPMKLC